MEEFMKYYLKDQRLADLYQNGNNRIKDYLRLIFERSYLLFVLHINDMRNNFWNELKRTKMALSKEDLHFLAKYGTGIYSGENVVHGILHGNGDGDADFDTTDVILREWRLPENIHYFGKDEVPPALLEWLNTSIEEFRNEDPIERNYYLKGVGVSFLFDDVWYRVFPSDLGVNDFTFEYYADGIMISLQSYGARYTRYEGMID